MRVRLGVGSFPTLILLRSQTQTLCAEGVSHLFKPGFNLGFFVATIGRVLHLPILKKEKRGDGEGQVSLCSMGACAPQAYHLLLIMYCTFDFILYHKNCTFNQDMKTSKVHTKEELLSAIISNSDRIKSFGVNRLGIFGSAIKGSFTESSDVDLLVEFYPEKKSFDNFIDLSFFMENLLGRTVEIITPQSLSKFIGPHILKEVENVRL